MANMVSDMGTHLLVKGTGAGAKFEILIPITSVPSIASMKPARTESTELNSASKQYVQVRGELDNLEFEFNCTKENFTKVNALCDRAEHEFALVYPEGWGYIFKGTCGVAVDGYSADAVIKGKITIIPTSIKMQTSFTAIANIPAEDGKVKPTGL